MRAMRAPISCFTNKKIVVSKWHGFFICKKCTLYVYDRNSIRTGGKRKQKNESKTVSKIDAVFYLTWWAQYANI